MTEPGPKNAFYLFELRVLITPIPVLVRSGSEVGDLIPQSLHLPPQVLPLPVHRLKTGLEVFLGPTFPIEVTLQLNGFLPGLP